MKILVVEDEKEIRDFYKKSLESECFVVDTAEDGEQGLQMALKRIYDLIILDNSMPKKTGLVVCEEIRKAGKDVPIIVVSVKSEATTKVDLLNAGADDYLTKPFSFDELLARIKALLRRPGKIEDEVIKFDDLIINTKRHIVKRGDKEIYLTRKEFALLTYFVKNQEILLSRSMIMEHVWDMSADPFSNTIESHIMSLRKKIDCVGKNKLIQTIPGRGYKLSVVKK